METMEQKDREYGIPEQKKFPLDSRDHVISAVKFSIMQNLGTEKNLQRELPRKLKSITFN